MGIKAYKISLPYESEIEVEDSWILIYDKISWINNGIKDLGLGISSVQLNICKGLHIDNIIISINISNKKPNYLNSTKEISIVSYNIYKPITGSPANKELMVILKEENKPFAIDMDLSQSSSKQFAQKYSTTDQKSCLMMVWSRFIKGLQLQRHSLNALSSGQLIDDVHRRFRKTWISILFKAN